MSQQLGQFVAEVARRVVKEALQEWTAGLAAYGTAGTPTADPDAPGRQVVDVTIGSTTWPAVPVRQGESIAAGDRVLVLMLGQASVSGWLVLKA